MKITVNQMGYTPNAKKTAVFASETLLDSDPIVQILNEKGTCVLETDAGNCGFDEASGDWIRHVDFTEVRQAGRYYLRVLPQGDNAVETVTSCCFTIGTDLYQNLLVDLGRTYYYQRCGMALEEAYAGKHVRPACHLERALTLSDYEAMEDGHTDLEYIDVSGGWHDAGDYGRYTTAAATAVAHLLYAWKWFPESFARTWNIPESGNGMPDILNECLYELKWLLKMQLADGSVWHKLTSMRHACFVMPEKDKRQLILFPASSVATADFAAVMALAFVVYREWDEAFAQIALNAAQRAWDWLKLNPDSVPFQNPKGCNTGAYDDADDRDERIWAAAELYHATGETQYLKELICMTNRYDREYGLGWQNVAGLSGFAMIDLQEQGDMTQEKQQIRNKLIGQIIAEAEHAAALSQKSGYLNAMQCSDYTWGSNTTPLVRGMYLAAAYKLTGKQIYCDCAQRQMDYLLGVNGTGYSFVTGYGAHAVEHIHHRVMVADAEKGVIPGFVSGGPNGCPCDEKAEWLIEPGTPPMKCFLDVWECYSLNENTIYWNASAVFLAAFLDCFSERQEQDK